MRRRARSGRFPLAVAASAGLHALALGLMWFSVSSAEPPPRGQVFRVDIVSPPPNQLGEPAPAPPAAGSTTPEPEPEAASPPPAAEPEPAASEPEPAPAPAAVPAPPKRAEPKRPAPESPRTPAPKAERTAEQPRSSAANPSPRRSDRPQETAQKAGAKKGEGPASRNPTPATGRNPDPNSPGGEGLAVRTEGAEFVDPAYLANIIRQLKRYFRPPAGAQTDVAEVRFWINRDGTVSDIAVGRNRGSFQFRAAAMEAVEQAGLAKAFGPLPRAYRGNRLPVSFTFEPES
ncbi:MAG TPA: TonB C-terminal domain-containing protein [Longimicrobiaceae bacterium]|jgi:outer membrane biosynthesis protein TonB